MARRVAVVPHTHWDREWYLPFQAFRMGLVEVLDEFLPQLDSDGGYDRFLLDGQMAVIDDYLELRPGAAARLKRLAESGRLSVGPWYILMDEFLVSGETMIRNLQLGLERAEALGGAMAVGYLPDMFGHVAQMPQLLRLAGFEHAVVWRGVPAAVDRSAFWWQAPDGSTVRAEYLLVGYGNGAATPAEADALVRRVAAHERETAAFALGTDPPMLWMNGTDHQAPQPWLAGVLAAANADQDRFHFAVTSLPEYLADAPTEGLPSWTGELRSGARANLLMGVASNRVDVKIAAARAERALERVAEPLCALWLPPARWPGSELRLAWENVVRNSAHDSVCACSHDLVGTSVLHRYSEATTIAEVLRRRALQAAAALMPVAGPVVLNPSARARSGVVEVVVPLETRVPGGQVVEQVAAGELELTGTGSSIGTLLGQLEAAGFRPNEAGALTLEVDDADGVALTFVAEATRRPALSGAAVLAEAYAQAGADPGRPLRIHASRPGWQRLAVHVADVPGFGWASWSPGALTAPPVTVTESGLTNWVLDVAVDREDGTWSIGPFCGLGQLVDEGDAGDTYNYSPPEHDSVVDRPESVRVAVLEEGPIRGLLRITSAYRWPARLDGDTRVGERLTEVVTDLELRAGEEVLRVTTSFDNHSRDHRVRAWFPLPMATPRSWAECAFAVVERGSGSRGRAPRVRPGHLPVPAFRDRGRPHRPPRGPARVRAGRRGLGAGAHPAAGHGDAVAAGHAATGTTRRDRPWPLEGPQMQGPVSVPLRRALRRPRPLRAGRRGVGAAGSGGRGGAGAPAPERGQVLAVSGAEVSALQRVGGPAGAAGVQPPRRGDHGHRGRSLRLVGRPAGGVAGALRRDLPAAPLGHRHRPPRRAIGVARGWRFPRP